MIRPAAGTAKQAVGDARCAAATAGNLFGAAIVHQDIQNFGRAVNDGKQIFGLVEIEAVDYAEAGAQGRCDQAGACGGAALSRIQSAVTSAEDDLRQVSELDARSQKLEKQLLKK